MPNLLGQKPTTLVLSCASVREPQFRIVLYNKVPEIERLGRELEAFGDRCGLSAKSVFELNLILEEIIVNIISYAYVDEQHHEIVIQATLTQGTIEVEVEDDGRPFNPLQVSPPDFCRPLEHMPVGGRGLHLVRTLTKSLAYERTGEKNRLVMRKDVESGRP